MQMLYKTQHEFILKIIMTFILKKKLVKNKKQSDFNGLSICLLFLKIKTIHISMATVIMLINNKN